MLIQAVDAYLAIRRAGGHALKGEDSYLKSFAAFSEARKHHYVSTEIAIEWASLSESPMWRARRLGMVIRFAHYLQAEDRRHEVPPTVFGPESLPRPTPYILTRKQIQQLVAAALQSRYPICRLTYSTMFSLMACTGLRVSEATRLRFDDITPDGLVIRRTKFRKSRLVPLHETAQTALKKYLKQRHPYAPFDDHVFVSKQGRRISVTSVDMVFRTVVKRAELPPGPDGVLPTPHSLRHYSESRTITE